jgi:hypothetical protein
MTRAPAAAAKNTKNAAGNRCGEAAIHTAGGLKVLRDGMVALPFGVF